MSPGSSSAAQRAILGAMRHWTIRGALAAAVLAFGAPGARACEACGSALSWQGGNWGRGFNLSIYFMLAVMALLGGGFALLVARSYRSARAGDRSGPAFEPEGKLRWSDTPGE